MMKILTFYLGITMYASMAFSQTKLIIPDNTEIRNVKEELRGFNHSAFSNREYFNNVFFEKSFPDLLPGIIRWPAGNKSQNYKWQDYLKDTKHFHLPMVGPYMDHYGVSLQIVTNFGNGSPAESADFVSFCNGSDPYNSHRRDSLIGRSSPLNVKYWEIGNESTDQWAFAWSWLGFQPRIMFQTGKPPLPMKKYKSDSLYYYGGSLFREGWVNPIGGLDIKTSVLGDLAYLTQASDTLSIKVEYPELDVNDNSAVRVYRTPGFNIRWIKTLPINSPSVQMLYDSIANPANLLPSKAFDWNKTEVHIHPPSGLHPGDAILIEYNSVNHKGAFDFLDAMHSADPGIQIGYVIYPPDELLNDSQFQRDFAKHVPDFMVVHSYSSGKVLPLINKNLYSEVAYLASQEVKELALKQATTDSMMSAFGVKDSVGMGLTEWNIALYDNAPEDHPLRGIVPGVYIASMWANLFDASLNGDIDLRVINHFALVASGDNFIHLIHFNGKGNTSLSVEGLATQMVMNTIGVRQFHTRIINNPQISVVKNKKGDMTEIDAIEHWGGASKIGDYVNLLLINRDDENEHPIDIEIPTHLQPYQISVEFLQGEIVNEKSSQTGYERYISNNTFSLTLPKYSICAIKIHLRKRFTSLSPAFIADPFVVLPNPASKRLYILTAVERFKGILYNLTGKPVKEIQGAGNTVILLDALPPGMYFFDLRGGGYRVLKKCILR